MTTITMTTILGLSCVVLAIAIIAFSRYRYWLVFMGAGMVFWAGLELLRMLIQSLVEMPLLSGYVTAFLLSLIGFTALIIWYDRRHPKIIKKAQCIEHTPVYENDHHYLH
jgi:hypothetical protein